MKTHSTKNGLKRVAKAFTLVEMTVVALIGILIAGMSMTLFNSQLTSFQILRTQNFLIQEAPQINNTLNQIISRANFFRLYQSTGDAEDGINAVIDNATVMVLEFRNNTVNTDTEDNRTSAISYGVIAFDSGARELNYYTLTSIDPGSFELGANTTNSNPDPDPDPDDPDADPDDPTANVSGPDWTISTQAADVVFFVQDGVLRTRITGPNGSQIIHSTTTQR